VPVEYTRRRVATDSNSRSIRLRGRVLRYQRDLNGDTYPDLAWSDGPITVATNNASGSFSIASRLYSGSTKYDASVVVHDFNRDGIADIAAVRLSSAVDLLFGLATVSLASHNVTNLASASRGSWYAI